MDRWAEKRVITTRNGGLDGTSAGVRVGDRVPYGSVGEPVILSGAGEAPPGNPGIAHWTITRTPHHRARSRASPLSIMWDVANTGRQRRRSGPDGPAVQCRTGIPEGPWARGPFR